MIARPASFHGSRRRSAVAAVVTLSAASAATGQIVPVSQVRSVFGDSNALGSSGQQQHIDQITAADFGPFADTLVTTAANAQASAVVETTQTSMITYCRLEAAGHFVSDATVAQANHTGYGVAIVDFRVTFQLGQPTPYRIFAQLEADDSTHVRLLLQSTSSAIVNILAADQVLDVARQGTLSAGQYTFSLNATGTAAVSNAIGTDHDSGSFNGFFTVCFAPADLDGDDIVNVNDLLAVINAWGSCTDPATCLPDLNGDQIVGVDDLLAVINAWG